MFLSLQFASCVWGGREIRITKKGFYILIELLEKYLLWRTFLPLELSFWFSLGQMGNISSSESVWFSLGQKGLGASHEWFLPWGTCSLWGSCQALPQPASSALQAHCCRPFVHIHALDALTFIGSWAALSFF